ncbi:MAG TPA: PspC domain-containing protein [Anaerolineales bacterium]|nr:PspC domain-containing protein [Anaerolineales bacterium]
MTDRLYRSRSDAMLGGVCAGIADYFGIDPTIVRLFFVVFTLVNGVGVAAYLVLWLLVPADEAESGGSLEEHLRNGAGEIASRARTIGDDIRVFTKRRDQQTGLFMGIALLALGAVFLLRNLGVTWMSWFDSNLIWPALLILAGGWILVNRVRGVRR